jgi:hypothetical protein
MMFDLQTPSGFLIIPVAADDAWAYLSQKDNLGATR